MQYCIIALLAVLCRAADPIHGTHLNRMVKYGIQQVNISHDNDVQTVTINSPNAFISMGYEQKESRLNVFCETNVLLFVIRKDNEQVFPLHPFAYSEMNVSLSPLDSVRVTVEKDDFILVAIPHAAQQKTVSVKEKDFHASLYYSSDFASAVEAAEACKSLINAYFKEGFSLLTAMVEDGLLVKDPTMATITKALKVQTTDEIEEGGKEEPKREVDNINVIISRTTFTNVNGDETIIQRQGHDGRTVTTINGQVIPQDQGQSLSIINGQVVTHSHGGHAINIVNGRVVLSDEMSEADARQLEENSRRAQSAREEAARQREVAAMQREEAARQRGEAARQREAAQRQAQLARDEAQRQREAAQREREEAARQREAAQRQAQLAREEAQRQRGEAQRQAAAAREEGARQLEQAQRQATAALKQAALQQEQAARQIEQAQRQAAAALELAARQREDALRQAAAARQAASRFTNQYY